LIGPQFGARGVRIADDELTSSRRSAASSKRA